MVKWNANSIIENFRNCRAGQFGTLGKDLGLKMQEDRLTACAVYCALHLRRDPTFGELRLWDRLSSLTPDWRDAPLTALETESAAIARTYADMMEKNRQLPDANLPLSPKRAFSLAANALERGGKDRTLKNINLRLTEKANAPMDPEPVLETASGACLSVLNQKKDDAFPQAGDVCILLCKGKLTHFEFERKISLLLYNSSFLEQLHGMIKVGESGILPALLSLSNGLSIHLPSFGASCAPEILVGHFFGSRILILPREQFEAITNQVRGMGIETIFFAKLTKGRKTELISPVHCLSVDTDFLRSLIPPFAGQSITLQNDNANLPPISHSLHAQYPCAFLPVNRQETHTLERKGYQVAAATVALHQNAFQSALRAGLASLFSCALSGVEYPDARLCVDLELPEKKADLAPVFAAAIGLYRLQAELGIPAAATRLQSAKKKTPTLTVFALGKGATAPAKKLTAPDSRIYLIPLSWTDDGLPDFPALRHLLANLAAQAKAGVIRSAELMVQETPKAVLEKMKTASLSARAVCAEELMKKVIPFGVLIETNYEMEQFEAIATVEARTRRKAEEKTTVPDLFQIPEGNGLIARERPEVVLLAPQNCPDAMAIFQALQSKGLDVKVFDPSEKADFLRAAMTANVVYRLPGAPLPNDPQAEFAFSVLRQNGGEIRTLRKR